jgi:hypothetical protein
MFNHTFNTKVQKLISTLSITAILALSLGLGNSASAAESNDNNPEDVNSKPVSYEIVLERDGVVVFHKEGPIDTITDLKGQEFSAPSENIKDPQNGMTACATVSGTTNTRNSFGSIVASITIYNQFCWNGTNVTFINVSKGYTIAHLNQWRGWTGNLSTGGVGLSYHRYYTTGSFARCAPWCYDNYTLQGRLQVLGTGYFTYQMYY